MAFYWSAFCQQTCTIWTHLLVSYQFIRYPLLIEETVVCAIASWGIFLALLLEHILPLRENNISTMEKEKQGIWLTAAVFFGEHHPRYFLNIQLGLNVQPHVMIRMKRDSGWPSSRIKDCCVHIFTEACLHHNTQDRAVALDRWNPVPSRQSSELRLDEGRWRGDAHFNINNSTYSSILFYFFTRTNALP